MELFVDDAGYVRAPASLVYRRLTDVASWPAWWQGSEVRSVPSMTSNAAARPAAPDAGEDWLIAWRVGAGAIRVEAHVHGWRHETGLLLDLRGDVDGQAEFWLEPAGVGTVVHHLFVGSTRLLPGRRLHERYRRAVRRGLWGLKDALHLEVRTMAGLRP